MKKAFLSTIVILAAAIAAVILLGSVKGSGHVAKSEASVEPNHVWKVALASYINERIPDIEVDGKALDDKLKKEAYMNEDLKLMFSEEGIREAFDCAIDLYDGSYFSIAKGDKEVLVPLDSETVEINDKVYIPVEVLENGFGYSYAWDQNTMCAKITKPEGLDDLPSYYNYMSRGKVSYIKNQKKMAACWAFASLSAVESSLLPEVDKDFSEDHMIKNNGFNLDPTEGGDFIMAISYLTSWRGPVLEEDDPYNDDETNPDLEAVNHVQEVRMIEEKDYNSIKKMIFKYGGVESSIYMALLNEYTIDNEYYDESGAYYYPYDAEPNHEVVIIGWDDNYSRYNFVTEPSRDGAFICLNSWGEEFGDGGVFYISYDDAVIGSRNEVYTRIDEADNYDNIYQHDTCGWTGRVGYNKNKAYFANVYEAAKNEHLKAVSFYATGADTTYSVYVNNNPDGSNLDVSGKVYAAGHFDSAGYYTVDLDEDVFLTGGERFAVIVQINTPGSTHPIAMEMNTEDDRTLNVVLEGKESYISSNGKTWERTQDASSCNVCLKAFTDDFLER